MWRWSYESEEEQTWRMGDVRPLNRTRGRWSHWVNLRRAVRVMKIDFLLFSSPPQILLAPASPSTRGLVVVVVVADVECW